MSIRFIAVLAMGLLAVTAAGAKERYFGIIPLGSTQQLDDFNVAWYSKHLAAMGEPSLSATPVKFETYRFLWLRTFDAPMVFRLTISPDGKSELLTKRMSGQGGYEPGELLWNKTTPINKEETEALLAALAEVNFWNLQSSDPDQGGFDGAEWILEGVKNGKYHVVDRWGGGDIRNWALFLMNKSGENLEPIY